MLNEELQKKYQLLQENLRSLGNVAVAFSSGVDSTLLLKVAHDVLGRQAVAVTARAPWFPARETAEAEVTTVLQTSAGRMIFAKLKNPEPKAI